MLKRSVSILALLLLAGTSFADNREEAARLNLEGIQKIQAGDYAGAVESFREARKLLPSDLTLRKNLATAYSRYGAKLLTEGNAEEGIRQLRHAVSLEPGVALHHANLGIALARNEETAEARKSLEKALLVDKECVPALVELGKIYYADGLLERAIRKWEKALAESPELPGVKASLEKAKRELAVQGNHTTERSAHFVISWDGEEDASVGGRVLRILEDAYEEIGVSMEIYPKKTVRVTLYTQKEFQAVTGAHSWVGGIFDGAIKVPVKNLPSAEREIRGTLYHEYTHVLIRSVTKSCPTWLNEGVAQYYEGKGPRAARLLVSRAKREGRLLPLTDLIGSFVKFKSPETARLAYAQSYLLTLFLLDQHGPDRVGRFLRHLGEGDSEETAAEKAFHRTIAQIHAAWEEGI